MFVWLLVLLLVVVVVVVVVVVLIVVYSFRSGRLVRRGGRAREPDAGSQRESILLTNLSTFISYEATLSSTLDTWPETKSDVIATTTTTTTTTNNNSNNSSDTNNHNDGDNDNTY